MGHSWHRKGPERGVFLVCLKTKVGVARGLEVGEAGGRV